MNEVLTIPGFFRQQCIFITGGTGFMGKVLLEKLLRSCPDLEMIYIIVRNKKNKSPEERWKETKKIEVFDRLKKEQPGIIDTKVKVFSGDVKQKKLGLSDDNWRELQEKVSIIFHCAASVRFNDPLPDAVFMNVRGSYEVVKLALGMSKLKVLVHVSTTYCNNCPTENAESMYPCPADWHKTIEISEKLDPRAIGILSAKYLGPYPNTYTFTKNLAEKMMWDHRDKLPIVIVRPSIVICSLDEPVPGWIDNLYGPLGLMLGVAKGVVRVILTESSCIPDYMAVDIAIKAMIIAAWKRGLSSSAEDVAIYNAASRSKGISNGEMMKIAQELNYKYPINEMLWYPNHTTTNNKVCYKYQAILKHLIPAVFIDLILKLTGKKPMLLEVQIRIYNAMMALRYFATKTWIFSTEKFLGLAKEILEEDKKDFYYNFDDLEPEQFIEMGVKKGKKFMLQETDDMLPSARKKLNRLYWIDKISKTSIQFFIGYAAYKYFYKG